jgi:uncharacterized protein YndB with AHSA1/START domain
MPMPSYLITNRVPADFAPSSEGFQAFLAWFDDLDGHLEDRGNPALNGATLGNCGPATALGGYTLISADNLDDAVALAESHPLMGLGGGVEIGELTPINAGKHLVGEYAKTIEVRAPADAVHQAITTPAGLSGWWTKATGSGDTGGELQFRFSALDPLVVDVKRADRPSAVDWTVRECSFMPDWVGTRPTFRIATNDSGGSELSFCHHGLVSELECFDECRQGWDYYLASLRSFVETGSGSPFAPEPA